MCAQTLPRTVEEAFDRADARAVLPRDVGKRIDVEIAGEEDAALARRERAQVALDALGEQPRVQRFVRLAADRVAQLFKGEKIFPRAALLRAVAAIAVDGALPSQTAEKSRKHRRALRRNGVPRFQIGVRAHLLAGKLVEENALRELQDSGSLTELLVRQDELKTLPFGEVWNEYCRRCGVPEDGAWLGAVQEYEKKVLVNRE